MVLQDIYRVEPSDAQCEDYHLNKLGLGRSLVPNMEKPPKHDAERHHAPREMKLQYTDNEVYEPATGC